MPDQSVAAQLLVIRSREISDHVALSVAERVLCRLDGVPLKPIVSRLK